MLAETTLVLGAGGPWGIAWMTGLILGLENEGIYPRRVQAIIGSSSGAILGARLGSDMTTLGLFEQETSIEAQTRQLSVLRQTTVPRSAEPSPPPASSSVSMLSILARGWDDEAQRVQAVCELALNANTISWSQFSSVMMPPSASAAAWPTVPLTLTAIDVDARSLQTFDRHSGVEVSLAVLASCAIPGIWPPVPINNRRYIDGGSWGSGDNVQLAAGAGSVLVISPLAAQHRHRIGGTAVLDRDISNLRSTGARVHLVVADEASLATRIGGMPDPASLKAAAEAGRAQGLQEAAALQRALAE
jgi:NTE family protein